MSAVPTNGNARWQTVAAFCTVGVLLIGSLIGSIVQMTRQSADIDTLTFRVNAMDQAQGAAAERGAQTREHLAKIDASLIEIETQFCSSDAIRNLNHANDLRDLSMLWRKVFDADLPIANAYYPKIGRCPE